MDVFTHMRAYLAVVKTGSFSRAADYLGISKALVSKYVNQLEARLGVRLLQRTTRRVSITTAGQHYFEQAQRILEDLQYLEGTLSDQNQEPRGKVRLTAPTTFGELYLIPWLAEYLRIYPHMQVEVVLSDRFVNLVDEGFDLALRIGQLKDSSLIAKRLGHTEIHLYGTESYLAQMPRLAHPSDLRQVCCIADTNLATPDKWSFHHPASGKDMAVKIESRFLVNSASAVKYMILAHQGVGICPAYVMGNDALRSDVVRVLPEYTIPGLGIYAVYPHARYLALKVRSLIDFITDKLQGPAPWQAPLV